MSSTTVSTYAVTWSTPGESKKAPAPILEQGHLLRRGHLGRVQIVRGGPYRLAVSRLVGQLDALADRRSRRPRRCDRLVGERGRGVGIELDRGREPERAVVDNPKAEAELEVVGGSLQPAVAQAHDLGADPLDACLGMLAAERAGPVERGAADRVQRKGQEFGVELYVRHG